MEDWGPTGVAMDGYEERRLTQSYYCADCRSYEEL